jgi:hypothetical protein
VRGRAAHGEREARYVADADVLMTDRNALHFLHRRGEVVRVAEHGVSGFVTGKVVHISQDEWEEELSAENERSLGVGRDRVHEYSESWAPRDTNAAAKDWVLEKLIYKFNLRVERGTRAFIVTAARAGVKSFRKVLKFKQFPDRAGNGAGSIGELWPVDEVTACGDRRSGEPGLSQHRAIQVEVMERKLVKEIRGVDVSRHRALSESGICGNGDVQVVSLAKQVKDLRW